MVFANAFYYHEPVANSLKMSIENLVDFGKKFLNPLNGYCTVIIHKITSKVVGVLLCDDMFTEQ